MPVPVWRKIVTELQVPKSNTDQWTVALEYVTPGKVMKIEVVVDPTKNVDRAGQPVAITGNWTPREFRTPCTADGDLAGTARENPPVGAPPVASAPVGALIARIGGSTADQGADTPAVGATPARIVFSVGRMCVLTAPTQTTGSLFLGVNVDPGRMAGVDGFQVVNIYEAL
jgi:hypothetical protein